MSELRVGQKKTYRIQKDAIAEFGNPDGFIRKGAYRFSNASEIWFPNLRQTEEEFSARGYNGEEVNGGEFLIEIARDERRLERVRNTNVKRIAFPRSGKHKPYCFAGLYKFQDLDKATLRITWKRIATKINTGDYPICRIQEGVSLRNEKRFKEVKNYGKCISEQVMSNAVSFVVGIFQVRS